MQGLVPSGQSLDPRLAVKTAVEAHQLSDVVAGHDGNMKRVADALRRFLVASRTPEPA
jgi:hypothetical protein